MKDTGFIRKVDENGRVVLPKDIRKKMGVEEGNALKMYLDGENLVIKKLSIECIICGGEEDIITFKGKNICTNCIKSLSIAVL